LRYPEVGEAALVSVNAMNYYVVLGVDEGADREAIRSAFRGLVRRYHPDAGLAASSDAFRAVVEAYDTLSDPDRRRLYDRGLQRSRVRSPQRPGVVVEPLGNRVAAEPIRSTPFGSRDFRRPPSGRVRVDLDDLFERVVRSLDDGVWFVRRTRLF
jgi:curved DNA-binding protein CbpA